MLRMVLVLLAVCNLAQSSGVAPLAPLGHQPVVTAASSQYFERTFNRLVAAAPVLESEIPIAPAPPVVVEPVVRTAPVAPVNPAPSVEPSVAIDIATAHAAAPVATILLPPYPFGLPATLGFVHSGPPINVPDDEAGKEVTTQPTTKVTNTAKDPEPTTPLPLPSNTANSFAQALPSNQNVNFKQYYAPPLPHPLPAAKPQKLKTTVEIVPVPLQYIAPPPLVHSHAKPIKYVHTFVPSRARIIIRPVSAPLRIRTVRIPARLVRYRAPIPARNVVSPNPQRLRPIDRDIEVTTFNPFNRPNTRPPRV